MNILFITLLALIAFINMLPVLGLFSIDKMEAAYGISINGNELTVLLQHRAFLFGLLAAFLLYSIFRSQLQSAAMTLIGLSMASFVLVALFNGALYGPLKTIVIADVIGLVVLLLACYLKVRLNNP